MGVIDHVIDRVIYNKERNLCDEKMDDRVVGDGVAGTAVLFRV